MNETYILITPARNEEAYIEKTIQSVISQTILPKKWVIVSDSSTDRTDEIVKRYEAKYDFIQLLRREANESRNFSSKVYAIQAGVKRLNGIEYDFIGNLDADISFEPNYYESVLAKFQENPKLGIAGGKIIEFYRGKYFNVVSSPWHVGGAIQLFRRKCYEEIGGYISTKIGGEDAVAEVMASMHGWKVKKYNYIRVVHNKPLWLKRGGILFSKFNYGIMDYSLGYHPLYEIVKCFYRIKEKPYFFSSIFRISGYCFALLRRESRFIPNEVIKYLRQEQMKRLKDIIIGLKRIC